MADELDQLLAEWDKLDARAERLETESSASVKQAQGLVKFFKAYVPPEFVIPGLTKDYVDAVKKSKGLTTALPSTTAALSKAGAKNPNGKILKAAVDALLKHKAEVAKVKGVDANRLKAFNADLDAIVRKIKTAAGA